MILQCKNIFIFFFLFFLVFPTALVSLRKAPLNYFYYFFHLVKIRFLLSIWRCDLQLNNSFNLIFSVCLDYFSLKRYSTNDRLSTPGAYLKTKAFQTRANDINKEKQQKFTGKQNFHKDHKILPKHRNPSVPFVRISSQF